MSIIGTCKDCGGETVDYTCSNCQYKTIQSLASVLRVAVDETNRTVASVGGPFESSNTPAWIATAEEALSKVEQ